MQLRETHVGRGSRFPKSETLFGCTRTFVEISMRHITVSTLVPSDLPRHVTFDSLSRKITSPEVTQCERTDISLTGHSFLRQFFPGAGAPIKVHEGTKFHEANREKESRCAYDFDRVPTRCARPMSHVPVKALHISILSHIIAFRYSPSNSIVFHTYLYIHFKSER